MTTNSNNREPSLRWELATISGISINFHISSIIIFFLIASSLWSLLTTWHPELETWKSIGWSLTVTLLLLASLILHELAHSVVAQTRGVQVRRITLFLFGGVAELQNEPSKPIDEFLIAAAGPITSLLIASAIFILIYWFSANIAFETLPDGGIDMSNFPVPVTMGLWLSAINFLLAVFNLLPGFPMDGGRLFRAVLWWRTGDFVKATLAAAKVGRHIGWLIALWGVYLIVQGNLGNGIWSVLIGWFIHYLAANSASQTLLQRTLSGFDVTSLMRTRFETVPADITVSEFIDQFLLRSKQTIWPTQLSDGTVGFLSTSDIDLSKKYGDEVQITEFFQVLADAKVLRPESKASEALTMLAAHPDPLPVVEKGEIVGLLDSSDIVRWLARNTKHVAQH